MNPVLHPAYGATNWYQYNSVWLYMVFGVDYVGKQSHNPQLIPQYHQRLGKQEIFWHWFKVGIKQENM